MIALSLLALVAVLLVGAALARALRVHTTTPELLPLSLAAGVIVLGTAVTFAVVAGIGQHVWTIVGITYVGVIAAAVSGRLARQRTESSTSAELILLAAAACLAVFMLYGARFEQLMSDGWSVWQLKAHALRVDGLEGHQAFHRRMNGWDYPLAWPALHAFVSNFTREPTWASASFVSVFCFLGIGCLLWAALRERVPAGIAALTGFAGVAAWGLGSWALAGFADAFVGFAVLGMVIETERLARGRNDAVVRLALYMALAGLLKNEGIFFAFLTGLAAIAVLLVTRRREVWRVWPLLLAAAPVLAWRGYLMSYEQVSQVGEFVKANLSAGGMSVAEKLALYGAGLHGLLTSWVWVGFLGLIPAGILAALLRPARSILMAWAALGLMLSAFTFAYLTMGMNPHLLARTSMPRLWGHFAPALAYLAVLSVFRFGHDTVPATETSASRV